MKHKLILLFFLLLPALGFCQQGSGEVKKVAILEVVDKDGNISSGIKLMLRSSLTKAITNMPGYEAYTRVEVDQIMKEQNFQRTGMVSDAQIKKLGEMSGASYILVAEAAYMDQSRNYLIVTATILNVESGKIDNTSYENASVSDLDITCNKLAASLFGLSSGSGNAAVSSYNSRPGQDQTFTVGGVTFKMVYVRGGDFQMGCTYEQGGSCDDDENVHQVTLDDYYIGEYEVTQALWREVMGTSVYQQRDRANTSWPMCGVGNDYPMYYVSYNEAQEFCGYLNRKLSDQLQGKRFALPTEAQWEYAARGGNKSSGYEYSGSNNIGSVAIYWNNYGQSNLNTATVKSRNANELGLYDMSGNVLEWCSDWYGSSYYSNSPSSNPAGPSTGNLRVLRGGSWYGGAGICRVSSRGNRGSPDYRNSDNGFRLVLLP